MKQKAQPAPLTESEREELIRLRAENEYIKTEIAVIKKEIALREEKKQRNSRRKSSAGTRPPESRIQTNQSVKSHGTGSVYLLF